MKFLINNTIVVVLVTLVAACGDSGSSGANNSPVPLVVTPPPPTGVVGDGQLEALAEWARQSLDVPAMAAVVVAHGQVAEMAAVGKRSMASGVPVTVDDRWHLGSLTKGMTATLAAVLIEQSIINWNTTPLHIWPELDGSIHPGFRAITLKQLLTHTSGMRRVNTTPAVYEQNAPGTAMDKRRLFAAELLSESPTGPAGQESYSNGGYVVAGAMMETIMSTSWESLLAQQVFGPLGMLDSGFGAPGTLGTTDQPWGHWDRGAGFEAVPPGQGADNPDTLGPAGTVHTTLNDYGQFMLTHIAGARGMAGLLTVPTFEVLHTPVQNGSALGWGVTQFQTWAKGSVLAHAGSNQRWYAVVRLAPALNAGVLIVVNAGGDRAEAAISALNDLILERFQASQL